MTDRPGSRLDHARNATYKRKAPTGDALALEVRGIFLYQQKTLGVPIAPPPSPPYKAFQFSSRVLHSACFFEELLLRKAFQTMGAKLALAELGARWYLTSTSRVEGDGAICCAGRKPGSASVGDAFLLARRSRVLRGRYVFEWR